MASGWAAKQDTVSGQAGRPLADDNVTANALVSGWAAQQEASARGENG